MCVSYQGMDQRREDSTGEGQARSFPQAQTIRSCVPAQQPSKARLAARTGAGEGKEDPSHHCILPPPFPSPSTSISYHCWEPLSTVHG